mmetsp:Transcript_2666/g.6984  ORF Transcript_2666/g.6984 Transcript_2666/m.6984 type:complete len:149 (-) Transcript_2666:664-1110(-)
MMASVLRQRSIGMYIKITTWRYVGYAHPRPQHQRIPDGRDALASALVPRNRSTPEAVVVKEIAFLPRFRRWEAEGGGSRGSLRLILFVVVERLKHVVVLYYHNRRESNAAAAHREYTSPHKTGTKKRSCVGLFFLEQMRAEGSYKFAK